MMNAECRNDELKTAGFCFSFRIPHSAFIIYRYASGVY